jgi:hypothetical protein
MIKSAHQNLCYSSAIPGLSGTWPAELYDVAHSHFHIYKILLLLFFYCIIHPRNPNIYKECFMSLYFSTLKNLQMNSEGT